MSKDFYRLRAYARRAGRRLEVQGRANFQETAYVLRHPTESGPIVYCTSYDDAVAIQCLLAHAEDLHGYIRRRARRGSFSATGPRIIARTIRGRARHWREVNNRLKQQ